MSTATNMWEQTESIASRHEGGSGTWIRLQNDGDREVVVFLGEPYPREVVFVDGKYELFSEEHKAAGLKSSLRVAINAAIAESREVKVLEMGVLLFKELAAMRAKRPLHKWSFEVQRHGAAKDPKTRYSLLPEEQLSAEDQAAFAGLDLIDLAALYGDTEAGGAGGSPPRAAAPVWETPEEPIGPRPETISTAWLDDLSARERHGEVLSAIEQWLPQARLPAVRRELLLRKGRCLIDRNGNGRDALLVLKGALILDETAPDTRLELLRAHVRCGELRQAMEQFRELVASRGGSLRSLAGFAQELPRLVALCEPADRTRLESMLGEHDLGDLLADGGGASG